MGFPLFRFTLNNDIEGTLEIKEPEGWDNGVLKLERNEDYHSLVEYYDQPLLFDDAQAYDIILAAILPGGMAYIKNIEFTQGIDAIITATIEISEDEGDTFETIFESVLDLPTVKETDFYKLELGAKRDDFWSKFINRKSIPVDLSKSTDEDGNPITPVASIDLPLPPQRIHQLTDLYTGTPILIGTLWPTGFSDPSYQEDFSGDRYFQIDFPQITLNEVETKFILTTAPNPSRPVSLFTAKYGGQYTFEFQVSLTQAEWNSLSLFQEFQQTDQISGRRAKVYIQKNSDPEIEATITDQFSAPAGEGWTDYNINESFTLLAGDEIRIYGKALLQGSVPYGYSNSGAGEIVDQLYQLGSQNNGNLIWSGDAPQLQFIDDRPESYLLITADTEFPETETDAFLIKDAAESIVSKITGVEDVIESDYLTSGCGEKFALMKGLHVRGYPLADKPFAMSFDHWWNGANPIFNLGLGYEQILGVNKIRIEPKSYFYDSDVSLNLDFVNNIERSYDVDKIIKSVEIGYAKWSAESASGVDDPQSKRTLRTRFSTVGKDEKILSQFIAASLAIEQTRRNRVEQGKDWRLDDETMIIALIQGSPLWQPEFDENFTSITNLLNSDARYNIRLSCGHNFQRWKNVFNGCLQIPGTGEFIFASGEGNYDMTSQLEATDCEGTTPETNVNEKGNVSVTDDFLWVPIVYEFEHPLTFQQYKTIRDNRTKAIGVSRSDSGHKACFIMNLDYKPTRGLGTFTVILGENNQLT